MPQKITYKVSHGCTSCDTCQYLCPVKAITFGLNGATINQEICIGCGTCFQNCPSEAIEKVIHP